MLGLSPVNSQCSSVLGRRLVTGMCPSSRTVMIRQLHFPFFFSRWAAQQPISSSCVATYESAANGNLSFLSGFGVFFSGFLFLFLFPLLPIVVFIFHYLLFFVFPHPCGTRLGVCNVTRGVNAHEAIFTAALLACGTFCIRCCVNLHLFAWS